MPDDVREISNPDPLDIGALFGSDDDALLGDALGEPQGQQTKPEPEPEPKPRQQQGGLAPVIRNLEKEIEALEKRSANPTESYTRKNDDGTTHFDFVAQVADNSRLQALNRKLNEYRERQRQGLDDLRKRNELATRVAKAFIEREAQKVPTDIRQDVVQAFAQVFQHLRDRGDWGSTQYANRQNLEAGLSSVLDTAIGAVTRQRLVKGDPAAPVTGHDEGDEGQPRKPAEGEEEDDYTNNLMYAYEKRKRGGMSVADLKRQAAAEAARKGGAQ
jgi:hypothetical protein